MSQLLLELPVIVTAFILQPAPSSPSRQVPSPCAARHSGTVDDCCVHATGWDIRDDGLFNRSAPPPTENERKASHGDLR